MKKTISASILLLASLNSPVLAFSRGPIPNPFPTPTTGRVGTATTMGPIPNPFPTPTTGRVGTATTMGPSSGHSSGAQVALVKHTIY